MVQGLTITRLPVPLLAATTTAAVQLRRDPTLSVYVSGDARTAAEPPLTAPEPNRLALRESAITLLVRLQGRM